MIVPGHNTLTVHGHGSSGMGLLPSQSQSPEYHYHGRGLMRVDGSRLKSEKRARDKIGQKDPKSSNAFIPYSTSGRTEYMSVSDNEGRAYSEKGRRPSTFLRIYNSRQQSVK